MEQEIKEESWIEALSRLQKEKETIAKDSLEKIAMVIQSDVSDDFKIVAINGLTNTYSYQVKQINGFLGC